MDGMLPDNNYYRRNKMESSKEYVTITDGTYILSETDSPNEFVFYRKDGRMLGDVGRIPMDMYEWRVCQKAIHCNVIEPIIESVIFDRSRDDTCLKLTILWYDIPKETEVTHEAEVVETEKKKGKVWEFFKRYFYQGSRSI